MTNSTRILRPRFSTHADGSDATLTIHEITGNRDGPTVGISGAIHGNEPTGTEIILDLHRLVQQTPIKGRLLLLPVANPRAYAENRRFTPIDELNLNREFPGDPRGNYTQQLAAAITREFLEAIDVHLDFHSGTDRPTVDYVYIWNDEVLSRSFGSTVLYRPEQNREGTTFTGTTKVVTIDRRGIPVVVVELGGGIVEQKPYVERGLAGLLNMLRKLGVIEGEVVPPPKQTVVRAIQTIRPTRGGLLETLAPPLGQTIERGELLGRIVSPYTFETLEEIPTPYDSGIMILSHLGRNVVEAGDYAYMVGDLAGAER
jgi:predicted deacylase